MTLIPINLNHTIQNLKHLYRDIRQIFYATYVMLLHIAAKPLEPVPILGFSAL